MKIHAPRILTVIGALALGTVVSTASPPGVLAADPGGGTAPADGREHVLTLITGDTVHIGPDGALSYEAGEGREGIGYSATVQDGDRYVIPTDAGPLLESGRLDRRLFDITDLVANGYADTGSLPLIVSGDSPTRLSGLSANESTRLSSIDADAISVASDEAVTFWNSLAPKGARTLAGGFEKVRLDGKSQPLLDQSVPQVGAPIAWQAGYDGTGVTVAVLDTGYDPTHPDLAGRVTEAKDFTGTSPEAIDDNGHGTHVASTVAGTGAASDGKYKGVAPGAKLLIGKVCKPDGCWDSDLIAGMEWASAKGATAVNLSLGAYPPPEDDPVGLAVERLTAQTGILFVAAAGNDGLKGTVSSPAVLPSVLAVGSVSKQDVFSGFSNSGPAQGTYAVKPDIAAPGEDITAAWAKGTKARQPVGDHYQTLTGTSMATPHVTGAVAILKQLYPQWTAERLKIELMSSAKGIDATGLQVGAGRLDVGRAITQQVTATTGSLSFGRIKYPYDEPPKSETTTYANESDAEVTLDLTLTVADTDGVPAPAGMFSMDKTNITIPAHGTANVVVTLDPAVKRIGTYAGALVAVNATTSVRSAIGAYLEPELYDVKTNILPRTGETVQNVRALLKAEDGHGYYVLAAKDLWRVPPGRYDFYGTAETDRTATAFTTTVTVAGGDASITVDLSDANEVKIDVVDRSDESRDLTVIGFGITNPADHREEHVVETNVNGTIPVYVLGGAPEVSPGFSFGMYTTYTGPGYQYNLNFRTEGRVPSTVDEGVSDAELARENVTYETQGVAWRGFRHDVPGFDNSFVKPGHPQALPSTSTEYFTPGEWTSVLRVNGEDSHNAEYERRRDERTPGTRDVHYNRAPVGVGLRSDASIRTGDGFHFQAQLFDGSSPESLIDSMADGVEGTTTLLLNGEITHVSGYPGSIGEQLPTGYEGRLAVRTEATRNVPWSTIGSRSTAEWSIVTTAPPPGAVAQPGRASSVRLNASGVVNGYAPRAAPQLVSLTVDHTLPDTTTGLTFEVSYDEGATWANVPVARAGDAAVAFLRHPKNATSVSVRMSATMGSGDTVTQSTIRSYGLK